MPKSPDAFRTISEVAEWLDTPAHVLRFWESKFSQVKPVKRAGGRRYYRPADMQLLGGIKKLLHDDGLTIKGAQKLLREHGVKHVSAMSQPLEDDLIEEAIDTVPEAAFEVALPEAEPPAATVISFQPRKPEPPLATENPVDTPAETTEIQAQTNETASTVPLLEDDAAQPAEDTTEDTFAPDTLPAFLKRAQVDPPAPAAVETVEAPQSPEKVTIDPVAHFIPADTPEPAQPAVPAAEDTSATPVSDEPSHAIQAAADSTNQPNHAPAIVPALDQIAPELDSFEAASSLLTALEGIRVLDKSDADAIMPLLTDLTKLRTRMNAAQNA